MKLGSTHFIQSCVVDVIPAGSYVEVVIPEAAQQMQLASSDVVDLLRPAAVIIYRVSYRNIKKSLQVASTTAPSEIKAERGLP